MDSNPLHPRSHLASGSEQETDQVVSIDEFHGPFEPVPECNIPECSKSDAPIDEVHAVDGKGCGESLHSAVAEVERTQGNSSKASHSYARVGVIKPGTYSRLLLRSTPRPRGRKLKSMGCWAVESIEGPQEDSIKDSNSVEGSKKRSRQG